MHPDLGFKGEKEEAWFKYASLSSPPMHDNELWQRNFYFIVDYVNTKATFPVSDADGSMAKFPLSALSGKTLCTPRPKYENKSDCMDVTHRWILHLL